MELVCSRECLLSLENQYGESQQMTSMTVTALMFGSPAHPPLTLSVSGKSTKMLQKLFTCIGVGKAGKSGLTRVGEEGGQRTW